MNTGPERRKCRAVRSKMNEVLDHYNAAHKM
jgi:hypothetical protein